MVRVSVAIHSRMPARHTVRTAARSPSTCRTSAASANATNGITAAFSKNSSPPKYTSTPVTAYRRRPVRTNSTASAHTQASAASIGSELSAAAHHANPGTASGVNSANVSGISSTWRHPRMTYSARNRASEASSCSSTRLTAGPVQSNGASRMITPATRKAAGITWPSWSSNRYDGDNRPWVPAFPMRIRSSQ